MPYNLLYYLVRYASNGKHTYTGVPGIVRAVCHSQRFYKRFPVTIVADILKNLKVESVTQGKQILESYGYISNGENALYHRFIEECIITAIVTLNEP